MARSSLGKEDWLRALRRLSSALGDGPPAKIVVIGGAAVALAYDARRTTTDVDAVIEPTVASRVLSAAEVVRSEFGLPEHWLNEAAQQAGFLVEPVIEGVTVLDCPPLMVVVPSLVDLTAMKLAAIRSQTDIDDALLLLDLLRKGGHDCEGVWTVVGGRVPPAERDKARYNLQRIWELIDEPG